MTTDLETLPPDQNLLGEIASPFPVETAPFPHVAWDGLLTPEAFESLRRTFPPLERFARHQGIARHHGQRPHDRYYLAYEAMRYREYAGADDRPGVIQHAELAGPWQLFIDELEGPGPYRELVSSIMGTDRLRWRYAWHLGHQGSEVSPHRDDPAKAGTHLFYFNTEDDWDSGWGGDTLLLHGKRAPVQNPEYEDFVSLRQVPSLGNRSLMFANRDDAWHGVRPLTCPPATFRRLFTVVFEHDPPSRAGSDRRDATRSRLRSAKDRLRSRRR